MKRRAIPVAQGLDSTRALLEEGYDFVSQRCARLGSDVFRTRVMLRKAYFARGEDAARMFYHPGRFTRRGAIPPTTLMLLQDRGSVQTLDDEAHRHRKAMFMRLMTPRSLGRLATVFDQEWRATLATWERQPDVVLHPAVQGVLTRAVCRWAAIPLSDEEAAKRTRELAAMIEGAGAVGPRNWRALLLRARTERWARGLVEAVRSGELNVPEDTPLGMVASHVDPDGRPLEPKIAGVELINLLRPTVAVARYVVFAALALHDHPGVRSRIAGDGAAATYLEAFVHEVRRFYPFFPLIAGRVRESFEWRGHRFDSGDWVHLDLYGTNHDARLWDDPYAFRPDRFVGRSIGAFELVPQGAGDHDLGHRCAGEWLTIELVKAATRLLTSAMEYRVPDQDLSVDLGRFPAIPASRFVIRDVRPVV